MPEQLDFTNLCESLNALPRPLLVAIEGFMNSGKSTLAAALAPELGTTVIHTDEFVVPGDESLPYTERLNYERLEASLRNEFAMIVEGICLRQVLKRINMVPSTYVYIKRISSNGLWHDQFHLYEYEGNIRSVTDEPAKSDLDYHAMVRPHEIANFIVQRIEP